MDNANEVISDLINKGYEICIVSMGTTQNLLGKEIWIKEHMPNVKFIGCNFNTYKDKSHVDMSDGILIDDEKRYLDNSNADIKICFGDEYNWNKEWAGLRCYNWYDVKRYLETIDRGGETEISCISTSHELAKELLNKPAVPLLLRLVKKSKR